MNENENENESHTEEVERTHEEIGRALGVTLDSGSSSSAREPEGPPRTPHTVNRASVGLPERPAWDVSDDLRPAAVSDALTQVERAAERANEAADRLAALADEEQTAEQEHRRRVQAADLAGESLPQQPARDWAMERRTLEAVFDSRREQHRLAAVQYQQAVKECLPEWQASLAARISETHRAARDAVPALHRAAEPYVQWRRSVAAADAAARALDPRRPVATPARGAPDAGALARGLAEHQAVLESDDDVLTGRHLLSSPFEPPRYVRQQWFDSGFGAMRELARLEAEEDYVHTDFTKGMGVARADRRHWIKLPGGGVTLA